MCKLGDEVHPCVSEEKITDRLGIGWDQQLGRSTAGYSGPLSQEFHKHSALLTAVCEVSVQGGRWARGFGRGKCR